MNAQDNDLNGLPKIDPRIFWLNIQFKLFIPIIIGVIIAIGAYKSTKMLMPNKWEASTYLIRHAKNMSSQTDIPYLYLQTDLNTVLETILLRENLEKVIAKLNLAVSPEDLRRKISVSKGSKTNVVQVSVTWADDKMSTVIADLLCETFLENYTTLQNSAAVKIYNYYLKKLDNTKAQLYAAYSNEKSFKQKHRILDFDAQKANLYKSVSELELKLMDEEVELFDLIARRDQTRLRLASTEENKIISQLVRSNDGNRTKELKNQLEILRKRYTEDNPKVQHIVHKIAALEQDQLVSNNAKRKFDEVKYGINPIHTGLELQKIEYETDILATQGNIESYQSNTKKIKHAITQLSSLEERHYQLRQEISSKQDLIQTLNNRLIETSIAMESNISDFDILEYAQTPMHPKKSYRKIVSIVIAGLIAIFITALILIREFMNNTIKTSFDLDQLDYIDFSGVIPNKDQVKEQLFYSQFQLFFSAIDQSLRNGKSRLLTISSLNKNDGKSFVANEVIENYLKLNKRVLHIKSDPLVHLDRSITTINKVVNQGGTCDQIINNVLNENLHRCYFQTDKQIYLDILEDENLERFLNSCQQEYDVIIWELFSPGTHLQLFKTINKFASLNLIVTKSKHTSKEAIAKVLKMLKSWEIDHVGLLLNLLPKRYIKYDL
jgi:uncharacterized protein involved in exopolysaccharide biosynthesis/Mrp family chromosome partitioning ATPase